MGFHHFANAGNFAYFERGEKLGLFAGNDPEHAVRLGLRRGNFRDQAGSSDSHRAVQAGVGFHALVQSVRGLERRTVEAFGSGHIQIGFVDRSHFHLRGECAEDFVGLLRKFAIAVGMSVDEDGVRAELGGGAQRHGGMDSELAGRIGSGGDDSAFVALASDDDGLAFERGIVELFHGDEEGVHVDVEDGAGEGGLVRRQPCCREILAAGHCDCPVSCNPWARLHRC